MRILRRLSATFLTMLLLFNATACQLPQGLMPGFTNSNSEEAEPSHDHSHDHSSEVHEHTFYSHWTYDNSFHWHDASCDHNVRDSYTTHTFSDWKILVEPSETFNGVKERSCKVCNYTVRENIPMSTHTHKPIDGTYLRIEPNCVSYGLIEYDCACGEHIKETLPMLDHNKVYDYECKEDSHIAYIKCAVCDYNEIIEEPHQFEEKIIYEATEYDDGLKIVYCYICGYEKEERIPSFNHKHDYEYYVIKVDPTCQNEGYTRHNCICGDYYDSDIVEKQHSYYSSYDYTPDNHWLNYHCNYCDDKYMDMEESHNFEVSVVREPTEKQDGIYRYSCICGYEYDEIIPSAVCEHDYFPEFNWSNNNGQVELEIKFFCTKNTNHILEEGNFDYGYQLWAWVSEPTCVSEGIATYRGEAIYNGKTYYDYVDMELAADPSYHHYEETIVAPTCEEKGYTIYTCIDCGYSYRDNYVPELGHNLYTSGIQSDQYYHWDIYSCYNCNYTENGTIEKHLEGPVYGKDEDNHWYILECSVCNCHYEFGTEAHDFSEVIVVEPTEYEDGYIYYGLCNRCDYSKTVTIPALGHQHDYYPVFDWDSEEPICLNVTFVCSKNPTHTLSYNEYSYYYEVTGRAGANCVNEGYITVVGYATYNGITYTDYQSFIIPMDPNTHNYIYNHVDPTCETYGYDEYICENCSNSYTDNLINPLGHDYIITPTYDEYDHYDHCICTRCNTEVIENRYPHSFELNTYFDDNYHWFTQDCYDCDYYFESEHESHNITHTIYSNPTEDTDGSYIDECLDCDYEYHGIIPALGHTHIYDNVQVVEPTCEQQGYTIYTCRCGDYYIDNFVSVKPHNFETQYGHDDINFEHWFVDICSDCGYSQIRDKIMHQFVEEVIVSPTEESEGLVRYTCYCEYSYEEVLPMLNHTHDYQPIFTWNPTVAPELEVSFVCSKESSHVLDFSEYTYGFDVLEFTNPTCMQEGYVSYHGYATYNGVTYTEDASFALPIDESNHDYNYETIVVEPTCEDQGYTIHRCICGSEYTDNYIDALSHNYNEELICITCGQHYYTEGLQFYYDVAWDGYFVTGYTGSDSNVVIPSIYEGSSVVMISADAFKDCSIIESIVIPYGIKYIGSGAFVGTSLTELTIPNSVSEIGSNIIGYDTKIETLSIPFIGPNKNDLRLYYYIYDNESANQMIYPESIKHIKITGEITKIVDCAFMYVTSLESIELSSSIVEIGSNAFSFTGIKEFDFTYIQWMGSQVFANTYVEKLILGSNLFKIDDYAFNATDGIENIYFKGTKEYWEQLTYTVEDINVSNIIYNYDPKHEHSYIEYVYEATCESQGYTIYTCSCGDSYEDNYVDALGHDYQVIFNWYPNWAPLMEATLICNHDSSHQVQTWELKTGWETLERIDPTCVDEGYEKVKGYVTYGELYFEEEFSYALSAYGHVTDSSISYDETNHWTHDTCLNCGQVFDYNYTTHTYSVYVEQEATEEVEGLCRYECDYCDYMYYENIPTLQHSHDYNYNIESFAASCTKDGYTRYTCRCGDYFDTDYVYAYGHNNVDGYCSVCGILIPSEGLDYSLIDGVEYSVIGIGTCIDDIIIIPNEYNGLPVTSIADYAFVNATNIRGFIVSDGVETIGEYAFGYGLFDFAYIPSSVTSIEALRSLSLMPVFLQSNDRSIYAGVHQDAFYYGVDLKDVIITDTNVYVYYDGVLTLASGNKKAKSTSYEDFNLNGEQVKAIGPYAYHLSSLVTADLNNGIESIGSYAFNMCYELQLFGIPESVTHVGECIVYTGLTEVHVACVSQEKPSTWSDSWYDPYTTIYIAWGVYANDIYYDDDIAIANNHIMKYHRAGIADFTKPIEIYPGYEIAEYTYSDRALHHNNLVTEVILREGHKFIKSYSFSECSSLVSVVLPSTIEKIETNSLPYLLEYIYYAGSEQQWYEIEGIENVRSSVNVVFNYGNVHEHSYTVEVIEPTCEEQGFTIYTCSCGDHYEIDHIEPLGHDIVYTPALEATCESEGYTEGNYCDRCMQVFSYPVVTPALGHDYVAVYSFFPNTDDLVDIDLVCQNDRSHLVKEEQMDVGWYAIEKIEPTCIESGFEKVIAYANYNGMHFETEYSYYPNPLDHNYYIYERVEPNCVSYGYERYYCSCGDFIETILDPIPATGHNLTEISEYDENYHYSVLVCLNEGCNFRQIGSYNYHNLSENIINYPTCEESGLRDIYCTDCEYEARLGLAPYGHDYKAYFTWFLAEDIPFEVYLQCNNDTSHIVSGWEMEIGWEILQQVDPTCTTDGYIDVYGYAIYDGTLYEKYDTYVLTASGEHIYNNEYVCIDCGHYYYTEGLQFELNSFSSYSVIGYSGSDSNIIIPAFYEGLPVEEINSNAFINIDIIESIYIGSNVFFIHPQAINACCNLKYIYIPASVVKIAEGAITWCASLTNIEVSLDNHTYDSRENCNAVIETSSNTLLVGCIGTVIPNSVTAIYPQAFEHQDTLYEVYIPENVQLIQQNAFFMSFGIQTVYILNKNIIIENNAFMYCSQICVVNFAGSETEWNNLVIGSGNEYLLNAQINYYYGHEHDYQAEIVEPTCETDGYTRYTCECGDYFDSDYIYATGHNKVDGYCSVCGILVSSEGLEYSFNGIGYSVSGLGTCKDSKVVIPEYYNGYPVTSILRGAIHTDNYDTSFINDIILPSTLVTIESSAISASNMRHIMVPESVINYEWDSIYDYSSWPQNTIICFEGKAPESVYGLYTENTARDYVKEVIYENNKQYIITNENYAVLSRIYDGDTSIPSEINGYPVTTLGSYVFTNSSITSINLLDYNFTTLEGMCLEGLHYAGIKGTENVEDKLGFGLIKQNYYCDEVIITVQEESIPSDWGSYAFGDIGKWSNPIKVVYNATLGDLVELEDGSVYAYNNGVYTLVSYDFGEEADLTKELVLSDGTTLSNYHIAEGLINANRDLKKVILNNTVTTITKNMFTGNLNLESVVLSPSVTKIDYGAFDCMDTLKSISFNGQCGLKEIGDYAFNECINLTSADIFTDIVSIGDYAFYHTGITYFSPSYDIEYIGEYAFAKSKLVEVQFGLQDSLREIGKYAFANCYDMQYFHMADLSTLEVIPEYMCYYNSALISVILPDSVIEIGMYAFGNCSNITRLDISSNLVTMGYGVFSSLNGLEGFVLPSSLDASLLFGNEFGTDGIFKIDGPVNLELYDKFASCNNVVCFTDSDYDRASDAVFEFIVYDDSAIIVSYPQGSKEDYFLTIPDIVEHNGKTYTVKYINPYMFLNYCNFSSVKIPDGIIYIGREAFYNNSSLTEVTLPSSLKYISNCFNNVSEITIPDNIEYMSNIGSYEVTYHISSSFDKDISSIIDQEYSLINYVIDGDNERFELIDGVLVDVELNKIISGCKSNNIPEGYTTIGDSAYSCLSFSEVIIPEGVEKIDYYAFYGCYNIDKVVIPSTIKEIHTQAFEMASFNENLQIIFNGTKDDFVTIFSEGINNVEYESFWLSYLYCYGMDDYTNVSCIDGILTLKMRGV